MDDSFFKLFDKVDKQNIEEGEFYTLVKGDLKVYLSYFNKLFDADDWDNDEAVVSAYRDGLNVLHYGGELETVLTEIKKILRKQHLLYYLFCSALSCLCLALFCS